jgi:outer membrane usher protein
MRRLWPRAMVVGLAVATAHAATDSSAAEPSILSIRVNGQSDAPTLVVLREGDEALLVRVTDLVQLRLLAPATGIVEVDGEQYLRIATGNGTSITFDDASQSADLTLPPGLFIPTTDFAAAAAVPVVTPATPGGFLNYELYGERTGSQTNLGTFLDAGLFGPFGVVAGSAIGRMDGRNDTAVRLDTSWTLDFPERLATLRVGDSISVAGAWGRAARFGGVQFGTNFATQPTLVTTPLLQAQGEAVLPSTVDVFVNGRRVVNEDVPPGPFTIDRVPAVTGAGQMQIVVTDALGRQQIIAQPFYSGPTLLRAGLNQYSIEAGAVRENYASSSNEYGDMALAGTWRRGITDRLTAEVHAEGQAGGPAAAGVDTAVQVGTLGILSLTAATGGDGEMGWLTGAGFDRNGPRFSLFARTRYASQRFAQLGTGLAADRPRRLTFGGVGVGLGRYGSAQASFGQQTYWNGPGAQTLGLSYSLDLGALGHLGLIASRTEGDDTTHDVFLNWTLSLGGQRTVGLGMQYSPGAEAAAPFEAVATMQQSVPPGTGTGYYASVSSSMDVRLNYAVQGRAGRADVQYARQDDVDGWRAGAAGGLAITGAGVMPSRRLDQSFAVVTVADYPDITVYVENQPVGRTDGKGRVLLDSLRAYERNAVSIDPKELPLDASLANPKTSVTPAYRSGPVVHFPVLRARAATLRLVLADGGVVPAGAQVTTTHEQAPVAYDGLVYLTSAEGRQQATARWQDQQCRFEFERPEGADPQPDLGDVSCRLGGAE